MQVRALYEEAQGYGLRNLSKAISARGADGFIDSEPCLSDRADLDLSRICAAPSARLGHLAFEGQGAFASQC